MHTNICIWLLLAGICTVVKPYDLRQKQNCSYRTFHQFQLMTRKICYLEAVILHMVLNKDRFRAVRQ